MRFGSVCSGIEAASVAWHPLGWRAAWLAEIEPFPSAVLAHHYPEVPNLGDITALPERILSCEVEAPDVLCGGTPCQAFSVAGLRRSLDDARGNLSLTFCEIADAIDAVRAGAGMQPSIIFWENVLGVLNTKDNAFGCFLAGLAGEDDPLQPPRGRWANAGFVLGPQRAVAWRVLDAQYFGVAQRRRRVFVVASARNGFDPAAVLFEFDGVRRDTAPSREKGEVAPTIPARSTAGGGLGTDFDLDGGLAHAPEIARCLATREGSSQDYETTTMVAYAIQAGALRTNPNSGPDGVGVKEGVAYTLEARAEVQAVAFGGDKPYALHGVADTLTSHWHRSNGAKAGNNSGMINPVYHGMRVRRLTPRECERLQGFPDDYTAIPWRTYQEAQRKGISYETLLAQRGMTLRGPSVEECPDGPRYKALGNSWAVPVVAWIGRRIGEALEGAAVEPL
ncbi:MAG: DNA cytosine methyltransferase [Burkholderiaceae bacterium]